MSMDISCVWCSVCMWVGYYILWFVSCVGNEIAVPQPICFPRHLTEASRHFLLGTVKTKFWLKCIIDLNQVREVRKSSGPLYWNQVGSKYLVHFSPFSIIGIDSSKECFDIIGYTFFL